MYTFNFFFLWVIFYFHCNQRTGYLYFMNINKLCIIKWVILLFLPNLCVFSTTHRGYETYFNIITIMLWLKFLRNSSSFVCIFHINITNVLIISDRWFPGACEQMNMDQMNTINPSMNCLHIYFSEQSSESSWLHTERDAGRLLM